MRTCVHELFRKRANLYQISVGIGYITGALSPRLCGGRKNRGCTIRECMLVFLVDISICGHIECQFHRTIEALGILKLPRDHLFESVSWIEYDAHVAQQHLYVRLNTIPISGKAEGLRIEIHRCFIVAGEKTHGVEVNLFSNRWCRIYRQQLHSLHV